MSNGRGVGMMKLRRTICVTLLVCLLGSFPLGCIQAEAVEA